MQIVLLLRNDNHIDHHIQSRDGLIRQTSPKLFFRRVENHSKVEIALRAVIATRTGAEGNDLQRVRLCNNAAHRFIHLFRCYEPVGIDPRGHTSLLCTRF